MTSLEVHSKSDHWRNKQNKIEYLLLKTNIFKYCVLFCYKWLKCTCNKGVISIEITGKCSFVLFRNFVSFNWGAKLGIYYFLSFCLTKQLRCATYGLETFCSYLGSIKHIYTSMVKQTISTS